MKPEVREQKALLRSQLLREAAAHTDLERVSASARLCARLREQVLWQQAAAVLLYAPLPKEPDVWPLLREALAAGKNVALPRYVPERHQYEARRVAELPGDLAPGHFGILEPGLACPVFPLNRLDFALIPGVGFTLNGRRLGRGKGYYDQLLAEVRGIKCGIAFDWQMVADLPAEPHDICLNCILTPTRWHANAGSGRF